MKLESIQKEVTQLYYNHLKDYQGGLNLSRPHIPLISEAYLKNRIIILGQETNTWYRQGEDDLLNFYKNNHNPNDPFYGSEPYREFIRDSVERYPGKFWEFSKKLYDYGLIKGPIQKNGYLGHCWINLFAVEAIPCKNARGKEKTNGQPTRNIELRNQVINIQGNLFFKLMDLLKPKIIIALTGKGLDVALFRSSLGLSFSSDDNNMKWINPDHNLIFDDGQICEVKITKKDHPLLNTKIIRTYHPNYFLGRFNSNKSLKEKLLTKGIYESVGIYYQNVLFKWLKENMKN